jgi:hypothetical protein
VLHGGTIPIRRDVDFYMFDDLVSGIVWRVAICCCGAGAGDRGHA